MSRISEIRRNENFKLNRYLLLLFFLIPGFNLAQFTTFSYMPPLSSIGTTEGPAYSRELMREDSRFIKLRERLKKIIKRERVESGFPPQTS